MQRHQLYRHRLAASAATVVAKDMLRHQMLQGHMLRLVKVKENCKTTCDFKKNNAMDALEERGMQRRQQVQMGA